MSCIGLSIDWLDIKSFLARLGLSIDLLRDLPDIGCDMCCEMGCDIGSDEDRGFDDVRVCVLVPVPVPSNCLMR